MKRADFAATYKSMPNSYEEIAISATPTKTDLKNIGGTDVVGLGQHIRFLAHTGDITLIRGDFVADPLAAGDAVILAQGESEEFYFDPASDCEVTHVSDGASKKLRILYNDEILTV